MIKKIVTASLAVLLGGLIASCSTATAPSDAYPGEPPATIYQKGRSALLSKSYGEAIKRFEALDVQYPLDADTEKAQLYLTYAYYMKEDYALAETAADRFIRLHPLSPHVDYAYYLRGLADYNQNIGFLDHLFKLDLAARDLTQTKKAYADFYELVIRYPNSAYAPAAYQYIVYLRNALARHELQTAQYYYNRQAYVAAANRASDIVQHYQSSPAVAEALKIMADSYRQLGLTRLEQDTTTVMRYNHLAT